jgi:hypothetical protein
MNIKREKKKQKKESGKKRGGTGVVCNLVLVRGGKGVCSVLVASCEWTNIKERKRNKGKEREGGK